LLAATAGGMATISLPGRPTRALVPAPGRVVRSPRFIAEPFQLGIASGDPLPNGVVLWSRLVTDPADSMSMGPDPIEVRWEIAMDDAFTSVVQSGSAIAEPALAHSVHVDVTGLAPAT